MSTLQYSSYVSDFIHHTKILYEQSNKLIKWNSEPESILELGIGNGNATKEIILPLIPKNITEYIGCDKFESQLEQAKQTISHNKFKTYVMDAAESSVPDEFKNRFHHIFCNNLFHHIQDTRQVLTHIMDMLKPGGQLVFTAFEKVFSDEAYDKLDQGKWSKYNNRKAISPFYRSENVANEYEKVIKSVGFVDCVIFKEHYFPRIPEEFFEELMTFVNYRLPFVNAEDKEEYLKDYKEEIKKGKMVKIIHDVKTGEKLFEVTFNILTGIVTKPL